MTGYSEEGDEVVLRMTQADYKLLVFLLGFAAGAADPDRQEGLRIWAMRLANNINVGNPHWTRYKLDEEE